MLRRLLALTASLAMILAACGDDEGAPSNGEGACGPEHPALFEAGKLTVATGETVYPPWMLDNNPAGGEGFENSVVYAVAAELGFDAADVVWVSTSWEGAIAPGAKDYDFNIQQYSITEERREVVDFSSPYYVEEKVLITFPDSPGAGAGSLADIQGLRYGAMIGTTDLAYIEDVIGATDVAVFDELSDVFLAMEGKQIEATVVGLPTALYATAVQVPDAIIAGILPDSEGEDGLGMLFEKGSGFVTCVDQALAALDARGELDAFATRWLTSGEGEIPRLGG
ncbi:MAG TPA: ABC transporter substrate-binding protein [Acidimicrobiia bacterium]|nr:ABC transporter substrate-binding protein [Acidimicrobiia bacterium]